MSLGITVDFNANMVKFAQDLDKISGSMDKFQARAEGASKRINSVFSGLGVGLSVAGLASFVKSGIDAADALNDLADRSGIAIEKLAGLEYAVKIGDTSMEAFTAASNKLSINMAKNATDFEKIGITAKDPVEAFKQLADRYSAIEDPQQRAALGAAAIGKSYAEMAPLLMMGADGMQELINKGQELNPITAEQARLAGEFNDKLEEMSSRSLGFRSTVGIGILEPLSYIGEAIDYDVQKFGIFEGVMRGFADGYKNFSLSGTGGGLSKELDQINIKIAEQKILLGDVRKGDSPGGAKREVVVYEELNNLLNKRVELEQKISDARRSAFDKKSGAGGATTADSEANNAFIQKTGDETDESGKKFDKASRHVKAYRAEIDLLNKSLTDAYAKIAAQRPDNLLQLENITATPEQQAELRRKALTQKNIEFDKANKTGNLADAARIAQEREQLAFENAREDLYGVRAGELPSYKAFDAKQNYNKAVEASKKAFDRFQATGQTGTTDQPIGDTVDGKPQAAGKPGTVDGKTDVAAQISQFEQLARLIDRVEKPIKIDVSSNVAEQIAQIDQLQQRLSAVDSSVTNTTPSGGSNANNTAQSLSTEVLKRGSRT